MDKGLDKEIAEHNRKTAEARCRTEELRFKRWGLFFHADTLVACVISLGLILLSGIIMYGCHQTAQVDKVLKPIGYKMIKGQAVKDK